MQDQRKVFEDENRSLRDRISQLEASVSGGPTVPTALARSNGGPDMDDYLNSDYM